MYELGIKNDITLNPGSEWVSVPNEGLNKLRLCFAHPNNNVIRVKDYF